MQKDAIQHIESSTAAQALNEYLRKAFPEQLAVIPENYKLEDLEKYNDTRRQFRAHLRTACIDDFASYALKYSAAECPASIFIDADKMAATSIFDIGNLDHPGHALHRATLTLEKTAPYRSLLAVDGEKMTQRKTAEWLEDFASYLKPWGATAETTMAKCSMAIRRLEVEAKAKSEHGERNYGSERSTLESIDMKSRDMELPQGFTFTCTPFDGLKEREFNLRLSMTTTPAGPQLCLRIVQHEIHVEEMAQEFKAVLNEALDATPCNIIIGVMTV